MLSVLVVFQLINFHKVNKFLTMKPAGEKNPRKVRIRRKTRSLTTWAPAPSAVTTPPDVRGQFPVRGFGHQMSAPLAVISNSR